MDLEEKKIFNERIDKLDRNVQKILFILESDNRTNSKGLVETVHENKAKVKELESSEKLMKQRMASYGAIGGAVITAFLWFVKQLISKEL